MAKWQKFEVELPRLITRDNLYNGFTVSVEPTDTSVVKRWIICWMVARYGPVRHYCSITFQKRDRRRRNFVMWLNYVVTLTSINGLPVFHVESIGRTDAIRREIAVSNGVINTKDVTDDRWKVYFKADLFFLDVETPTVPLSVNVHDCYFMKDFAPLFDNPDISDILFIVGDTTLHAHKSIVGAKSPVFRAMFKQNMAEKVNRRMEITDCSSLVFYLLLRFIYEGDVQIPDFTSAIELLKAANFYKIKDLKELCQKYISERIDNDNVADVILLSELNVAPALKNMAMRYLCNHSYKFDMGKLEEIKRRSLRTFSELLEMLSRNIVVQKKILPGFYTFGCYS